MWLFWSLEPFCWIDMFWVCVLGGQWAYGVVFLVFSRVLVLVCFFVIVWLLDSFASAFIL